MKAILTMAGSVLVGALVLLGIGGIVYHMFRDDGWIAKGLGAIWEAHYQAPVMTIILIVAGLFVVKYLHSAQIGGKRGSIAPTWCCSPSLPPESISSAALSPPGRSEPPLRFVSGLFQSTTPIGIRMEIRA